MTFVDQRAISTVSCRAWFVYLVVANYEKRKEMGAPGFAPGFLEIKCGKPQSSVLTSALYPRMVIFEVDNIK